LVLRLRFAPELWKRVSRRLPELDRAVESFLASVECLMVEEPELVVDEKAAAASGRVRRAIFAGGFEFRLRRPDAGWWDWDIVGLLPAAKRDAQGVRVEDQIVVLKPDRAFPGEVAFVINKRIYRKIAPHMRAPIGLAWHRIRQGRDARRVFWNHDVIFLLTPNLDSSFHGGEDGVANLKEALESTGAGCVITDPYELQRIREMVAKFGETLKV
jgi:hypothetical protein